MRKFNKEFEEKRQVKLSTKIDPEIQKLQVSLEFEDYADSIANEFDKCERFVMSEAVDKLLDQEYTKAKFARRIP